MGALVIVKFVAVFIFVISLMLFLSHIVKRSGIAGPMLARPSKRRLKIVEFLPVDHKRRLVLVRCDDREHLLLLGQESETVIETGLPPQEHAEEEECVVSFSRDPRNVKV